ncbi:similar to DnaK protein [Synechococcus elongatus PCC 6301]|uniref:Similar to DnaK protein n=1 Tax=Synechococcus sp. (strain ATCC 27144 / PCC 6301 / SAUG 1402/1) TaxID=269084 RepID=A0A0H3K5Z6_SYNP6|nr:Hsp70 family protein [Synechococcus elongatus]BAD79583.1 similar to DnaK protein [Synechococcus elongatus PCC 6301]
MAIALDFGTSNTVVARWNTETQSPELLSLTNLSQRGSQTPPLIPSLLYVEEATMPRLLAGQAVRDQGRDRPQDSRFFRSFKRGIGAEVTGFLPDLDGVCPDFEQVGQWFLDTVIAALEPGDRDGADLVLTVPVDSFENYRLWLSRVAQQWPVDRVRLIDEPTAAALGYGVEQQSPILVFDFGGGTLDLALIELGQTTSKVRSPLGFILKWGDQSFGDNSGQRPQLARVLAKAGRNLGGNDLDDWLTDYFAKQLNTAPTRVLTRLAERIKIQLSTTPEASEVYFDDETLQSLQLQLDRSQFQQILHDRGFSEQLDELLESVLQQGRRQGINPDAIAAVLMVGGSAQIPAVQDWLAGYFPTEKIRCDRPFEAVACGALQLAQGLEVRDFLYHSYGIRYWNHRSQRHDWHPLIPPGQAYPMAEPVELVLGASVAQQPSMELVLGELSQDRGATEIFFDGDRLITRRIGPDRTAAKALNDSETARTIARLDPPGDPGVDRLRLQFWVDRDRFLRVTIEDLLTLETVVENQVVIQL